MSTNGATISQMNVVRKQVEVLKGGGLARLTYPATVSLIAPSTQLCCGPFPVGMYVLQQTVCGRVLVSDLSVFS